MPIIKKVIDPETGEELTIMIPTQEEICQYFKVLKKQHKIIIVYQYPKCNFCDKTAYYDVKLPEFGGAWGNLCEEHFNDLLKATGKIKDEMLGLGKGQELITKEDLIKLVGEECVNEIMK
ncbi:MAG: hypothetical protein ABIM49_02305 [candidate division WOR-3 bacterium]